MDKFKQFIKDMRFEYKVLSIVFIILLLSVPYSIIKKKFFPESSQVVQLAGNGGGSSQTAGVAGTSLTDMQNNSENSNQSNDNKPTSISEAVNNDRPLIIDETAVTQNGSVFEQIMIEIPEIKNIELATQVENPTVWIYSLNDGLRKDEEAVKYCEVLHSRGIIASKVTIYDERERRKGRLIELGTANCM